MPGDGVARGKHRSITPTASFSPQKDVLKSDLLLCSVAAVLSFAVSASTVFLSLRVSVHLLVPFPVAPGPEGMGNQRKEAGPAGRPEGVALGGGDWVPAEGWPTSQAGSALFLWGRGGGGRGEQG